MSLPTLPPRFAVAASVISYSLCSGFLLLANKVVLTLIPSSPVVIAVQCLFCIAAIGIGNALVGSPKLSEMTGPVWKAYLQYGVLFVGGIYTNMRALEESNVDTVIVFRSATPLVVALGEWALMGRSAPSLRSLLAMLVVFLGSALFVVTDSAFAMKGLSAYFWCFTYLLFISAEMLFGKQITSSLNVTLGTSVLLTNAMGIIPFLVIGAGTGELGRGLNGALYTPGATTLLAASAILSAGIGFSSWWCRGLVSATSFTVIGTVNKIITVLVNIMIWDKHASAVGTLLLFLCLAGGAAYQQAPMRTPASGAVTPATVSGEGKRTDSEPAARAAGEAELAPLASERVKVDVDSAEPVAEVPSDLAEPTPPRSRAVAAGLA